MVNCMLPSEITIAFNDSCLNITSHSSNTGCAYLHILGTVNTGISAEQSLRTYST